MRFFFCSYDWMTCFYLVFSVGGWGNTHQSLKRQLIRLFSSSQEKNAHIPYKWEITAYVAYIFWCLWFVLIVSMCFPRPNSVVPICFPWAFGSGVHPRRAPSSARQRICAKGCLWTRAGDLRRGVEWSEGRPMAWLCYARWKGKSFLKNFGMVGWLAHICGMASTNQTWSTAAWFPVDMRPSRLDLWFPFFGKHKHVQAHMDRSRME